MLFLAAALIAAIAIAAYTRSYGTSVHADGQALSADTDPPAGCASGVPPQRYDLGTSFAGMPRTALTLECDAPNLPPGVSVEGGPPPGTVYWDAVYGDCSADSEDGCPYPVEVQSWAECLRNESSYITPNDPADDPGNAQTVPAGDSESTTTSNDDDESNPWDEVVMPGYGQLPVVSFDDGTRIEIYAGRTTVVIFGDTAAHAMKATTALAPTLAADGADFDAAVLANRAAGNLTC